MLPGEKVRLRAVEREDLPLLTSWFNDAATRRMLSSYRPMSLADETRWYEGLLTSSTDQVFCIDIDKSGSSTAVGLCGLHRIDWKNRHAMVGILVGNESDRGKGHGTDAMRTLVKYAHEELGLMRVWLEVFPHNVAGIKSYENVGFVKEGAQRNSYFRDGRFHDLLLMSCLFGELKK